MLTMAVGQSDDVDPARAIADAIAQCRPQLAGQSPSAGILFAALDSFDPSLIGAVQAAFPGIRLIGSTSAAELSSIAGYREDSVALALFASDDVDLTVGIGAGVEHAPDRAAAAAVAAALAGTQKTPRVCVMLTSSVVGVMQQVVEAVARALPPDVVLVGGVSSGNDLGSSAPTFQFCDDTVVSDGVGVLVMSGPVVASVAVGAGWRPLGRSGVVTRSEHGRILEIDGRPAHDFVAPYLEGAGASAFGNPLAVREAGASDSYLRVVVAIDPSTGTVTTPGRIPEGATVQLTSTTSDSLIAAVGDTVRRAGATFPDGAHPQAALIFPCAVRKFLLGSRTSVEVQEARALLPPIPIAGMYCVGEIAPIAGSEGSRLLNESFVTLLLGG
jgi:hypothetical protein